MNYRRRQDNEISLRRTWQYSYTFSVDVVVDKYKVAVAVDWSDI